MPHFTIDQTTGYLYFLYYDRRNFANGNLTDVFVSVSRDGGKTFSHHKINEKTFSPSKEVFFGDYIGISAHNGVIRPMWMQMDEGKKLGVYTAIISENDLLNAQIKNTISFNNSSPFVYNSKTKVLFNSDTTGLYSAYLYKATDPTFEVKVTDKGKLKKGVNDLTVKFKKLKLTKGTYVLMLYNNNRSYYVWIQEE